MRICGLQMLSIITLTTVETYLLSVTASTALGMGVSKSSVFPMKLISKRTMMGEKDR